MGEVSAVPLGVDFPSALVRGLLHRMDGQPPEAMARVQLFLNTARMRRRVVEILTASGARLLPRIHLLGDLAKLVPDLPEAVPPLRLRLELSRLIAALLPNSELRIIPAAGHLFMILRARQVAGWIETFIRESCTAETAQA